MKNTRKLVSALLVSLLLLTSLIALAGGSGEGFIHTLPEEPVDSAAPVTVPSEGVAPYIGCDHSCGTVEHEVVEQCACFRCKSYIEAYCAECNALLETGAVHYGENSDHKGYGYFKHGDLYYKHGVWYLPTYCPGCGEHLTDGIYEH